MSLNLPKLLYGVTLSYLMFVGVFSLPLLQAFPSRLSGSPGGFL